MNNCLIKIVRGCSLCGVLSLKCDSCLIKTVQRCSPCGVRVVIEKGVISNIPGIRIRGVSAHLILYRVVMGVLTPRSKISVHRHRSKLEGNWYLILH